MMTPEQLTELLARAKRAAAKPDCARPVGDFRKVASPGAVCELVERVLVAEWMIEFLQQHNGAFMCPAVLKADWCQHPERIATGDFRYCSDLPDIGAACWIECGKRQARAALNLPEEGEPT